MSETKLQKEGEKITRKVCLILGKFQGKITKQNNYHTADRELTSFFIPRMPLG